MSLTQLRSGGGPFEGETEKDDVGAYYDVHRMFTEARRGVLSGQLAFLLIGRGRCNDLMIEDRKRVSIEASKVHAALTCDNTFNVSVMDVASTNGTFVNGARLLPYVPRALRDGDVIRFGREFIVDDGFQCINPLSFLWSARDPPPARARARPRTETFTRDTLMEHLMCPACADVLVSARVLACGHATCHACLVAWFTPTRRTCPLCRTEHPAGVRPAPCHTLDALADACMATNASVTERSMYERRVAHAKIADVIRARCEQVGAAKD
jgi:hypothetical protein